MQKSPPELSTTRASSISPLFPLEIRIELARTEIDWEAIREICCLTGNGGEPVDRARFPFFAENWIGPYQKLLPNWAWVVRDGDRILGYLVGCPDTREFYRKKLFGFDLGLVSRIVRGEYERNADTRRCLRRTFRLERSPESSFSAADLGDLRARFPAHLHMNLLPAARGKGAGLRLVEAFATRLRSQGIPGIHLFCGDGPVPFYLKAGFARHSKIEFRPGIWVHALARPFG